MTQEERNKMGNYFGYMRISTQEERKKQTFSRQQKALERYATENKIKFRMVGKDDRSGKNFEREEWENIESLVQSGDTIVFADLSRFTRQADEGYKKYMQLFEKGVNLVFLNNPTISTDYIKQMYAIASSQQSRITKKTIQNTIELLLLVELDRVEQERQITVERIKNGIKASGKKSGRPVGKLDKMTDELKQDIQRYISDRSIKQVDLMVKYHISRNTLKKYIKILS